MPDADDRGSLRPAEETSPLESRGIVVELFVHDVEASIAFYKALGFSVARRYEDYVLLRRGEIRLSLQGDSHVVAGPHYFTPHIRDFPRGTGVEISIQVADVDAEYIRARTSGLNIVKPMQDRPWGARDFRVADPDGYFLRITSPLKSG
jgi:catechol 2,3-dioxygenase-like lactoylglutathione lyase family enzyme